MKLYNIYQNIILEEIFNKLSLLNEGVIEDIDSVIKQPVYVWLKYKTDDGVITDRYCVIDAYGPDDKKIRIWQTAGKSTNTKNKTDGGITGYKTLDVDKIIPNSIRLTKMVAYEPIKPSGIDYNETGDRSIKGRVIKANYRNK
jgi:hypothetical protein